MATERQRSANRANSKRSTGPKSTSGKARAAQNATRHGLTARPDPSSVSTWLSVILGAPELGTEAAFSNDPRIQAAFELAIAEVNVARMRESLDLCETGRMPRLNLAIPNQSWHSFLKEFDDPDFRAVLDQTFGSVRRIRAAIKRSADRETQLFRRYLKGAERRRARAFQEWVGWMNVD